MSGMSRFINGKSNIHLICMPAAGSKKFLKIKFKASGTTQKDSNEEDTCSCNSEHTDNMRSIFRRFDGPERTEKPLDLPRTFSSSSLQKTRVAGGLPVKSNFKSISEERPKAKFSVDKFSNSDSSLLKQKVRSPRIFAAVLIEREHISSKFLSVLTYTGRMVRNKTDIRLFRTKRMDRANTRERLSEFRKLQLFQTLLKQQLPILVLRTRFGISKQTLKGLCKRRLVAEVWGPGTVGLRFKLTQRGKAYLNELEAAAKYDSHISKRGVIRLKNKS
jgi:hypothetical protein